MDDTEAADLNVLKDIYLYSAVILAYAELDKREIRDLLGDEIDDMRQRLQATRFTLSELLKLSDMGWLTHEQKNQPAHAPQSGRIIVDSFSFTAGGRVLVQFDVDGEAHATLKSQARVRAGEEIGDYPETVIAESLARENAGGIDQSKIDEAVIVLTAIRDAAAPSNSDPNPSNS